MGLLLAHQPPAAANNAMTEYLPYMVMTDSLPFDSWVTGRGITSVLAYVDLAGGMTSSVRRLSRDFNCFTFLFFDPDLTEMIFDEDLDLNVYFCSELKK